MNIIEQLRRDEGDKLTAYRDSEGYLTIGVGVLIDDRKGGGITKEESAMLLANRLKSRQTELDKRIAWWRKLNEPRQAVLLNMSYQMGVSGLLGFTETVELTRIGDYPGASKAMLISLWADQTPERAKRLSKQMLTGEWV